MQTNAPRILSPDATPAFLRMLGLSARARKLAIGTNLARDAIRSGRGVLVVLCEDASNNSKKRILDTAAYYQVPVLLCNIPQGELGHAIGKSGSVSALCVTCDSFAVALEKIYKTHCLCTDDSLEV